MSMTSSRPYMIRALYEWILDNECTPYTLVNAMADNVEVPQQFVKNGQIVLNISPMAIRDLVIGDDMLNFNGRFSGVPMDVFVPMAAIMGIYAKENGQGMMFDLEEDHKPEPPEPESGLKVVSTDSKNDSKNKLQGKKKPGLHVVK